ASFSVVLNRNIKLLLSANTWPTAKARIVVPSWLAHRLGGRPWFASPHTDGDGVEIRYKTIFFWIFVNYFFLCLNMYFKKMINSSKNIYVKLRKEL
uniref:Uncharacterized protein n=1 Tax=Oryza brachyantha TaxID=4533 RepID=J3LZ28_ORYBR